VWLFWVLNRFQRVIADWLGTPTLMNSDAGAPGAAQFNGALIVFVLCLGFFVTPAVLGGGKVIMVSNQITNNIELFFNWGAASALGVVLLVLTLAILWAASKVLPLDNIIGGGH
jgi:putative spermidine/putrescine transport system permease protein/spermidine/putrescine transport system permease protein